MTFLDAKRLFSKDVLDTRFTKSSWAQSTAGGLAKPAQIDPAKPLPVLGSHKGSRSRSTHGKGRDDIHPSKWATSEYVVYYIVVGIAVPLMFKAAYDVSTREQSPLGKTHCTKTKAD